MENKGDEDDEKDGEENGLVVQDHDGFLGCSESAEPLELGASAGDLDDRPVRSHFGVVVDVKEER